MPGDALQAGARLEWSRLVTAEDIQRFAELSGDQGQRHSVPDPKGRLMAHGLLTASLPTKLGGDLNFVARRMEFEFLRPAYAGDQLTCLGRVESVEPARGATAVKFSFTVTNQRGKVVMRGMSSGLIQD